MIRPTVGNLVMVTIMAIIGIWASKALLRAVPVRGLSDLVAGI